MLFEHWDAEMIGIGSVVGCEGVSAFSTVKLHLPLSIAPVPLRLFFEVIDISA